MPIQIVTVAIVTSFLFTACKSNVKINSGKDQNSMTVASSQNETKLEDVSYTVAKNYFVNNTVIKLDNPKIETADKFNQIFGMAATMGEDGKPTEINFTTQYVIAIVLPETDSMTTVEPVSLQKNTKSEITLTYKLVIGEKQSYITRPNFAIIVNKAENGPLTLKKIN